MSEAVAAIVTAAEIPGRGRGLIAGRDIKPGEVILSETPLLLYPAASSSLSRCCSHCFRSISSIAVSCYSSCRSHFCSPPCQSAHSPFLCAALRSFPASKLGDDLFFSSAQFLIAALSLPPSGFQTLISLSSPAAAAANEYDRSNAAAICSLLSSLPLPQPPCGISSFTTDLAAALLTFDNRNAFGLMEPPADGDLKERKVRAYAIYPTASFFNHDCLPNACRFDYLESPISGEPRSNAAIVVRAIHDIPAGREVCISYFPVNWNYKERQCRLQEDYGFDCHCDRCEIEKNWKDSEEHEHNDNTMEEEDGNEGEGMMEEVDDGDSDFPHAYFFVRFVCDRENCGGTLAPLPPSPQGYLSDVMECNVCGLLRKQDDIVGEGDGSMTDQ